MKSGFFKAVPNNTSGHKLEEKAGFIWVDKPDEAMLSFIAYSIGSKYYEGCTLIPADKNDSDFIKYVEKDIKKVQKDIEKLERLKQNLLEALN